MLEIHLFKVGARIQTPPVITEIIDFFQQLSPRLAGIYIRTQTGKVQDEEEPGIAFLFRRSCLQVILHQLFCDRIIPGHFRRELVRNIVPPQHDGARPGAGSYFSAQRFRQLRA